MIACILFLEELFWGCHVVGGFRLCLVFRDYSPADSEHET